MGLSTSIRTELVWMVKMVNSRVKSRHIRDDCHIPTQVFETLWAPVKYLKSVIFMKTAERKGMEGSLYFVTVYEACSDVMLNEVRLSTKHFIHFFYVNGQHNHHTQGQAEGHPELGLAEKQETL